MRQENKEIQLDVFHEDTHLFPSKLHRKTSVRNGLYIKELVSQKSNWSTRPHNSKGLTNEQPTAEVGKSSYPAALACAPAHTVRT